MQNYSPDDPYEREPLDSRAAAYHQTPSRRPMPANNYSQPSSPYHDSSPRLPAHYQEPSPYGRHHNNNIHDRDESPYASYGPNDYAERTPEPPRHGDNSYHARGPAGAAAAMGSESGYAHHGPHSNITPGADNFSESASGGMSGVAYNVADRNPRESGMEAMRGMGGSGQLPPPPSRTHYGQSPYSPAAQAGYGYDPYGYGQGTVGRDSNSNLAAIGTSRSGSRSPSQFGNDYDNPFSTPRGTTMMLGDVNPNDIADDGDDGLHYPRASNRNSMLSSQNSDRGARAGLGAAAAVGGAAAAGGLMTRSGKCGRVSTSTGF